MLVGGAEDVEDAPELVVGVIDSVVMGAVVIGMEGVVRVKSVVGSAWDEGSDEFSGRDADVAE